MGQPEAWRRFSFVDRILAGGGCAGVRVRTLAARTGTWDLQIVKRTDVGRFVALPKRGIVECTLGWVSRSRRLCRDYECHTRIAAAFVRLAMIRVMLRRRCWRARFPIKGGDG